MFFYLMVIFALSFNGVLTDKDLTGYVSNCHSKDPKFNDCLQKFLQNALQNAAKGIPEFSIDSLDPYFIPHASLHSLNSGLNIELRNTFHIGLSTSTIKKLEVNADKFYIEALLKAERISLIGDYELNGKLFTIPVNGNGHSNFTMIELQTLIKLQGERDTTKTDSLYMKVKTVTTVLKVKRIRSYLADVFKNNRELSNIVNQLMNDNWDEVYNQFKPNLENEFSKHIHNTAQKYFSHIPYKTIFPD